MWPPAVITRPPCGAQEKTALIWAAEKGEADVAQLLIGEGKADAEAKNNEVSAPRVVRG